MLIDLGVTIIPKSGAHYLSAMLMAESTVHNLLSVLA